MTNTERRKRALNSLRRPRTAWTQQEVSEYHKKMQALQEQRRALRIAKQRELLRGIDYSDLEEE